MKVALNDQFAMKILHFMKKYIILRKNCTEVVKIQGKKIVNCQLIKLNCQFDNIGNALSNIIIDNKLPKFGPYSGSVSGSMGMIIYLHKIEKESEGKLDCFAVLYKMTTSNYAFASFEIG